MKHELLENHAHSFIVKVWLEKAPSEGDHSAVLRGHITHVPDGERRNLKALDGIEAFIASYVEGTGARPSKRSRVRSWLERLWKHLRSGQRGQQFKGADR
jgi:hypothetical protein